MGENELSFDNILGEQEIETLFDDAPEVDNSGGEEKKEETPDKDNEEKETKTAEVTNPDDLFDEPEEKKPESVGSEKKEDVKEKEDTTTDKDSGTSPNENFYSSIASACAVDGIFPNLDDDTIKKANDAESFSDLIEAEVNARLDEKQQRISKALENGIEPTDIRKYENTLNYISKITDAQLSEEGEKGENLRKNLIYQDFINKGYTPEKAQKYTERSIDNGTDVEDARDALQGNKEYFSAAYNQLLKDAQENADAEKAERAKQAETLKKSIFNDKQLFGDMELSKDIRKKAFENISRPVYKDPETGEYLTALQKYEVEHRADFLKYAGLIYTLTDGFKDFESFTKGKVKKEVRKGLRELEHTLNNTSRDNNGNLQMVSSVNSDPNSYLGKGIKLDF